MASIGSASPYADAPVAEYNPPSGAGKRVLVTGASGFVAGHCIRRLLELGYMVRGTVRNTKDNTLVENVKKLVPNGVAPNKLELVAADLLSADGWSAAVQDCDYVLHTASPAVVEQPRDENELIKPAVEGTLAVLRAAASTKGRVRRVVVTSSVAAVASGHNDDAIRGKEAHVFSEVDWSNPTGAGIYP
jgi:dihydroflavonol-4-reductase